MRNNSQRPGCMRALPASQSCHVRRVEEMSAAAAVWEIPTSSLACRISVGVGLFEVVICRAVTGEEIFFAVTFVSRDQKIQTASHRVLINVKKRSIFLPLVQMIALRAVVVVLLMFHDFLRLSGLRCATHELHYTRIPCKSKKYFKEKTKSGPSPAIAALSQPCRKSRS